MLLALLQSRVSVSTCSADVEAAAQQAHDRGTLIRDADKLQGCLNRWLNKFPSTSADNVAIRCPGLSYVACAL